MQCLTRSPEHQSGCVPSDSPQMLYGSLWICFRSLAQKPAQPFLHHVVWIMQELDGESYDFWEKHFLPRPLNQRDAGRPPMPALRRLCPAENAFVSSRICRTPRTAAIVHKSIVVRPVPESG